MACDPKLLRQLQSARELPTLPAVLVPLLRHLERPLDSQDVHEIVILIAKDESLAVRCLQVANSPLFGCSREVESIQAAVVALGLERIHQIAVSCSFLKLLPSMHDVSPSVFWAHSLGCALVAREFATKIGFADPGKAYAGGLLHDVGIIALLSVAPEEFARSLRLARAERIALHEAEQRELGIDHEEAGKILAEIWHLPSDIREVIAHHHTPGNAAESHALVSIVAFSDLLCRLNGIGYGFSEAHQINFAEDPAFLGLAGQFAALQPFDLARFTFETEGILEEVRAIVNQVYGAAQ
ncbi:MAG TPA: HDOD domain-containing protein [Terriglobales bacterium]|jgi:HD-like signal output (HDOD) protein